MKKHSAYSNLLQFNIFDGFNNIQHFSTTRDGGVSKGEYSSFNMGNFSDDSPINIHENRTRLATMFFMNLDRFIIPHQTHGTTVLKIDEDFLKLDTHDAVNKLYGVDGVITNIPKLFLCVTTADCVPVIMYDTKNEAIAAVHSGWKGTSGNIVKKAVNMMKDEYGTFPQNLLVGIGPAISMNNYEVGNEVIEIFDQNGFDIKDERLFVKNEKSSKYHIDLKEVVRQELLSMGVHEANIEKSDLCTYDNEELFFSARRQSIHSGRMLTGIMIGN
ncbi:MAG: peptidoglycan editing factor PgeF [Fermentimonas sp.]|jgi:YfiH family protein